MSSDHALWAITTFFNPAGYRARGRNYRAFFAQLSVPLLTVELVYGAQPELTPADATHLIQLRSDQVLWQKERLLNLALEALPPECRFVVWLDCDLVFQDPGWAGKTQAALEQSPLVQPFGNVFDLSPGAGIGNERYASVIFERESMAKKYVGGAADLRASSTSMLGQHSPGHAWAARREALETVGYYDAMILGSGDVAMAMAAIGRHEDIVESFEMNLRQAEHYRAWARRWHAVIDGGIGVVDGDLYHLWHGDLNDRGYDVRYAGLKAHDFDPSVDIKLDRNGCWMWNSDKRALHDYVRRYFTRLQEDVPEAAQSE
jgi:hypothetical protein